MNDKWPLVRLGDVLIPASRMKAVDPLKEYRLLGVRLEGRGPFLRETVTGSQSAATKLFRVSTGDFIYSRLFACRGAFGVISSELNGCYVSGEFPVFTAVSDRVDVQFLRYWFRLPTVIARVDADCSGSTPLTRNRFNERFFVNLEVPLPALAEQRRMVERIEQLTSKMQEVRDLRQMQEAELDQLLIGAFRRVTETAPQRRMRDIAPLVRRPVVPDPLASYRELGIRSFGKGTFHKPALTGAEIGGKRVFQIEPGDLLFSNVFAWEGAIAVAKPEDVGRIGSHRFISCLPKLGVTTAHFLCFYFLTPDGLELIRAASPGGALRNRTLGLAALEDISVPVPRIEDQHWFDALQVEVAALRQEQAKSATGLDALLPATLDCAFRGEL